MDNPTVTSLITPAPDATSFEADGAVWTLDPELSVSRAKMLQRFSLELMYDTSTRGIVEAIDRGWDALNKGQQASGIYEFGRLRDSINLLAENRMSDMNIVALFYNEPGENLLYNHQQMLAKMKRWEDAGVAAGFFTVRAFALLRLTSPTYPLLPETLSPPSSTAAR